MIAIVDYDAGNTCSVMNALDRLDVQYVLSDDQETLRAADKVIFPGVGHAGRAMEVLHEKGLVEVIKSLQQPVLGICVGMQLLFADSEEGDTTSLGIIDGQVRRFENIQDLKVPHMGWNNVSCKTHPLFNGIESEPHFYFVHSYYAESVPEAIATCHYGIPFTAAVQKENFYGIQFHAEKSGSVGAQLLSNFLNITS